MPITPWSTNQALAAKGIIGDVALFPNHPFTMDEVFPETPKSARGAMATFLKAKVLISQAGRREIRHDWIVTLWKTTEDHKRWLSWRARA